MPRLIDHPLYFFASLLLGGVVLHCATIEATAQIAIPLETSATPIVNKFSNASVSEPNSNQVTSQERKTPPLPDEIEDVTAEGETAVESVFSTIPETASENEPETDEGLVALAKRPQPAADAREIETKFPFPSEEPQPEPTQPETKKNARFVRPSTTGVVTIAQKPAQSDEQQTATSMMNLPKISQPIIEQPTMNEVAVENRSTGVNSAVITSPFVSPPLPQQQAAPPQQEFTQTDSAILARTANRRRGASMFAAPPTVNEVAQSTPPFRSVAQEQTDSKADILRLPAITGPELNPLQLAQIPSEEAGEDLPPMPEGNRSGPELTPPDKPNVLPLPASSDDVRGDDFPGPPEAPDNIERLPAPQPDPQKLPAPGDDNSNPAPQNEPMRLPAPTEGDEEDGDTEDEESEEDGSESEEDSEDEEDEDDSAASFGKGDFPALPPDPNEAEEDILPPLEQELFEHGGSYLYAPEGDHLNWPDGRFGDHAQGSIHHYTPRAELHQGHFYDEVIETNEDGEPIVGEDGKIIYEGDILPEGEFIHEGEFVHGEGDCFEGEHEHHESHYDLLRLPEDWCKPKPFTIGPEFLGADAIVPWGRWFGGCCGGYAWEPRFVGYGSFSLFGLAQRSNQQEQYSIGGQLLLDLDLRLTGTERFHMQFRPIGEGGTGGSYYNFTNPGRGYVDNSTITPDRYWFEGELGSIVGPWFSPFASTDYSFTVGRFPFALHNNLLMNDDILGVVINKNTILAGPLSNLNVQAFYGFDDVNAPAQSDGQVIGLHLSADHHHDFYEATYAFLDHKRTSQPDAHYVGLSRTQIIGNYTLAGRAFGRIGVNGQNSGGLFVLESNMTRYLDSKPFGVDHVVYYLNAHYASTNWSSIAGGNFNRLSTSFEVSPLIQIAAGRTGGDSAGVSLGAHLFRDHEDESLVPELALEVRDGEPVIGLGARYMLKTSARTYFEALGVLNFSDDPRFERQGVFISETVQF